MEHRRKRAGVHDRYREAGHPYIQITNALKQSPTLRCIAYCGGAAVALRIVVRSYGPQILSAIPAIHLKTMPLVAAWTWLFIAVRDEDRLRWMHMPGRQQVVSALLGGTLGAGTFLALVGIAASVGWVQLPTWGWARSEGSEISHTLLYLALGHAAVAWNEEVVFRGYGFDTAAEAFGRSAAIAGSTILFALHHGPGLQVFVGQSALGLVLTVLRLRSGSLSVPISYHFAWNYMQTAILGPPDALPSLRPLEMHGPDLWMGKPGYPVPGLLMTIANLTVALLVWITWRRRNG